jgi:hypothetical protein
MERQQLLKAADKGVISKRCPTAKDPAMEPLERTKAKDRHEPKNLLTAISDLFGKKTRSSFICDVIIACFLVFNCALFMDPRLLVDASPVITEKQLSTYHRE